MAMNPFLMYGAGIAAINAALLLVLIGVWARNYSKFGSQLVLGLLVFGVAMLVENAAAVYFFFSVKMLYAGDPGVQQAVLVLRFIQFVAVAVLTYVTWK